MSWVETNKYLYLLICLQKKEFRNQLYAFIGTICHLKILYFQVDINLYFTVISQKYFISVSFYICGCHKFSKVRQVKFLSYKLHIILLITAAVRR